jgi:hypothetical protein
MTLLASGLQLFISSRSNPDHTDWISADTKLLSSTNRPCIYMRPLLNLRISVEDYIYTMTESSMDDITVQIQVAYLPPNPSSWQLESISRE